MKTVVLDGTDAGGRVGKALRACLEGQVHAYFKLGELDIRPCRSCGTCSHKTPGECVIRDDMPGIVREIAGCDVLAFVTPVTFGGYGSALKKAVDRLMVLGLPLYTVEKGRLLHPMRYGRKFLVVIGVSETPAPDQAESFRLLGANNALNFGCRHRTVIVSPGEDGAETRDKLARAFREVS